MQNFSYIDYFLISNNLKRHVCEFNIIDEALNLSDHCPIKMHLTSINTEEIFSKKCNASCSKNSVNEGGKNAKQYKLRWDHSNCDDYYEFTRLHSEKLYDKCLSLLGEISAINLLKNKDVPMRWSDNASLFSDLCTCVDVLYNELILLLAEAGDTCIEKYKVDVLKFWWDEESDALKMDSISTHNNWRLLDRPNSGPIFEAKKKAKSLYRLYLRKNMGREKEEFSNSLHDSLMAKNQGEFWKVWRKKFGSKKNNQLTINNSNDHVSTANDFSNFFAKVSNSPSNVASHDAVQDRFHLYRLSCLGNNLKLTF